MYTLHLSCPAQATEATTEALELLACTSVTVRDAYADTAREQALFDEPTRAQPPGTVWNKNRITALFTTRKAAEAAARILCSQPFFAACKVERIEHLPNQDWVTQTRAQSRPIAVTDQFWIVPSWHQAPPGAKLQLRLDPGLAFGTGSHPTTLMCLRWMARHAPADQRVLDYGCGSGILAIAAMLLGARETDAVDLDAQAIQATLDNARRNGLVIRTGLPEDVASGTYDLVMSNILAGPLEQLAARLCGWLSDGGHLVLAGILEQQFKSLQACYSPWLDLQVIDQVDDWILLHAQSANPQAPDVCRA